MKDTLETRLGIFFALALLAAGVLLEMVGGFQFFKGGYHVGARFDSVQQLKVGDPVKMAGVEVGRVEQIRLGANRVEVIMKVDRDAPVRTSSTATIKFLGLMGQNYVAINFGSTNAPIVTDGNFIKTIQQPDLSSLMTKLDHVAAGIENVTKTFSGDKFTELLGPFTDFLKENRDKFTAILANVQAITKQVADGQGTIGKLIQDQALYNTALGAVTNLNGTATGLHDVVQQAKTTMAGINGGQGTIGKLITEEALYRETTNAMTNLREILQKINRGQGSVGKLVNDESLFKNAKLTLQKVDKATEGLEDQGPLSVLGIAVNNLF
jgi:phospholipid/cholesterol/gamma-HCH transport system substrate-binding protein